ERRLGKEIELLLGGLHGFREDVRMLLDPLELVAGGRGLHRLVDDLLLRFELLVRGVERGLSRLALLEERRRLLRRDEGDEVALLLLKLDARPRKPRALEDAVEGVVVLVREGIELVV